MAAKRSPSFRVHKATGQGYVVLDGHFYYLGRHDRPEARQEYHRLVHEWLAADQQAPPPADITIAELLVRYLAHVESYYRRPDGSPTSEPANIRAACRASCHAVR